MNTAMPDILTALIMLAVAVVLVAWFLRYKETASERRMMSMLRHVGVDTEIARRGDAEAIIMDIRQRCRKCQTEDVCERWLAGEQEGDNDFCPNAEIFDNLKDTTE